MSKTVNFRFLILATLFGFLGGALSSIALPQLAFAQNDSADVVTAREFRVVDERGRIVGVFGAVPAMRLRGGRLGETDVQKQNLPSPGEGKIMLMDADGTIAWSAPGALVHPLTSGTNR